MSISPRSNTDSLKIRHEKKTSIAKIKYLLQHWKKSSRQVMQGIVNMSLESRSWWHIIHGHVQLPLSTDPCLPWHLAWIKQKAWESSIAMNLTDKPVLAAFVTETSLKKSLLFCYLILVWKLVWRVLRVVPCLQHGLLQIFRLMQLFWWHCKSISLCNFLVKQVWREIQTV